MSSRPFSDRLARINSVLVALLAFALPLSTSAVSLLALGILLLWLLEGRYLEKLAEVLFTPVAAAVLLYLVLVCLGVLWTEDLMQGLHGLQDHWKLAMLPIFLTSLRHPKRLYLFAFLAGMGVALLLTFLAWFDLIRYADVTPRHLTPGTFHVIYNPLLAFALYFVLHESLWGQHQRRIRLGLCMLAPVMVLNMFITEGRTGQLAFMVLMALLLMQIFQGNRLRALAVGASILPFLCAASYLTSPVFQQRINLAWQEIKIFREDPNTSVGLRLQFFLNSLVLIQQQPCWGVGTGGFEAAYAVVNQERSPHSVATDNPHNQYLLSAALLGLPGLLSLLLIFASMFFQALTEPDRQWQRLRVAFPLFFLVIMLAESYLKVYQTAFFFSLLAAVLYKQETLVAPPGKRFWLILSYRANIPGSACSQHLDDRLPHLQAQGIEPLLLTGPIGERTQRWQQYRSISLAPSGIRFEVRHFLRRHVHKRWQFKSLETLLLFPIFPLYLLEKIVINLESEWSWFGLASLRGLQLCRSFQPEVLYSTGGSASAHVAALLIQRQTGLPWLAETQDPLVHDQDWQRSRRVLALYQYLERQICRHASHVIFLVQAAATHCEQRTKNCPQQVIYPGAEPSWFAPQPYRRGPRCCFAHFGSLAGTRNLSVFFQALEQVLSTSPEYRSQVRVELYGSCDSLSQREMVRLRLQDIVVLHGAVPRSQALAAMQQADCLLLVQNLIYFSCETIPSKVYEYLLTSRPILGLIYHNQELAALLTTNGHKVVPADDVQATALALRELLAAWVDERLVSRPAQKIWTVAEAVERLCRLPKEKPCA
jgi:O-antigen ligase